MNDKKEAIRLAFDRDLEHVAAFLADKLTAGSSAPKLGVMTDTPSRGEIDAKLQAAEARTETRFVEMRADMDVRFGRMEARIDRLVDVAEGWAREMRETRQAVEAESKATREKVEAENRSTRTNLWVTAVGATIAVVLGMYSIHSLNLATQANLLSAFQAKEAAATKSPQP